jgi:sporulation protein YlmC with PRC-barrel domain
VDALTAIGRDALMIEDDGALVEKGEAPQPVREATADRDVIGVSVITEDGTALGEVTDVVVSTGRQVEVVGYELGGSEVTDERDGRRLFIPLVDQVAVSGDALIVPSALADFVGHDLTGFGAAIARYRSEHGSGGGTKARTETVSASSPTKAEVYAEARRRGVRGRSSMTKAQLASALSEVDV